MRISPCVLATAAIVGIFSEAVLAGYTATTAPSLVVNTDTGSPGGSVGDSFSIGGAVATADGQVGGTFKSFIADSAADPQLSGGDLDFYRYNLNGTIDSLVANVAQYTGTYSIFYDLNLNGEPDEAVFVSLGNFAATATFDPVMGEAADFVGTLTQTQGPTNPAFADLSYNGQPVQITGKYMDAIVGDGPSPAGLMNAVLRQSTSAVTVPEPTGGWLVVLGVVVTACMRRS